MHLNSKKHIQLKEKEPKIIPPWRRWLRRIFWLLVIGVVIQTESLLPEQAFDSTLGTFTVGQRFNWVVWETNAIVEELSWWVQESLIPNNEATQKETVLTFLERQRQINELEGQIRREYAKLPSPRPEIPPAIITMEDELADLRHQQETETPVVEQILAAQVNNVLISAGLGNNGAVWPPITFRFTDLPTFLVISPRDEIRLQKGVHTTPGMPASNRSKMEEAIEAELDVSALVDNLGGIGSWPTMVIKSSALRSLLDIIAHEWAHTYFLFHPLGQYYDSSREMTTINETVASIVGEEVATLVLARYYPEMLPPTPTPAPKVSPTPTPQPTPQVSPTPNTTPNATPEHESFGEAMRRIRLHVDDLLAQGKIQEAEAYMETERQKLAESGYYLRKLNQAYFAFHGNYATSPTSVDPIGPWLRQLREESGSLKAFMDQVAPIKDLDDLLKSLEETKN